MLVPRRVKIWNIFDILSDFRVFQSQTKCCNKNIIFWEDNIINIYVFCFFAFALIFGCLKNYCHEKNNISPIASDRTISGNIIDQTQGWNIHGNDVPEQFKMDQHDMTYNAPVTIYIYIMR